MPLALQEVAHVARNLELGHAWAGCFLLLFSSMMKKIQALQCRWRCESGARGPKLGAGQRLGWVLSSIVSSFVNLVSIAMPLALREVARVSHNLQLGHAWVACVPASFPTQESCWFVVRNRSR